MITGDIIMRVQPASETDTTKWAFYASSASGDDVSGCFWRVIQVRGLRYLG